MAQYSKDYANVNFLFETSVWKVYSATNARKSTKCSIWEFKPNSSMSPELTTTVLGAMRSRLLAVQSLSHPNIIKVFEVSDITPAFYFVTEPVQFRFTDILPLTKNEALYITTQLIDVLKFLHCDKNYAYLNITPENIVVSSDMTLKFYNFLFMSTSVSPTASVIPAINPHSCGVFTVPFNCCSPEFASGSTLCKQSDIFQFALIAIQAFTGMPCMTAHSSETYDIRQAQNSVDVYQVPENIQNLFKRCLSADPSERPTAGNLAVDQTVFTTHIKVLFYLRQIQSKTVDERYNFYNNLGTVISDYSPRLLSSLIIPEIVADINDDNRSGTILPVVMPSLLTACSKLQLDQLSELVLRPLLISPNSRECARYLLGNIANMTGQLGQKERSSFIVALCLNCLDSSIVALRARAAEMMSAHMSNIDVDLVIKKVYPTLVEKLKNIDDEEFIANSLKCFSEMVPTFGVKMSMIQLLPQFSNAIKDHGCAKVAESVSLFVSKFNTVEHFVILNLSSLCMEALTITDASLEVQTFFIKFVEKSLKQIKGDRNINSGTEEVPHLQNVNPFMLEAQKSSPFGTFSYQNDFSHRRRVNSMKEPYVDNFQTVSSSADVFNTTVKPVSPVEAVPRKPPVKKRSRGATIHVKYDINPWSLK